MKFMTPRETQEYYIYCSMDLNLADAENNSSNVSAP